MREMLLRLAALGFLKLHLYDRTLTPARLKMAEEMVEIILLFDFIQGPIEVISKPGADEGSIFSLAQKDQLAFAYISPINAKNHINLIRGQFPNLPV